MKVIRLHQTGGPEVLQYEDAPDPAPAAGQAIVKTTAIGVNFADIYNRSGLYPNPMPYIPGMEAAGTVAAVAEGVTEVKVGDRVVFTGAAAGYAELVAVPAARLVPIPAGISDQTAAAVLLQGLTAHALATGVYPLKTGDRTLMHAGAGGVGLLLIQIGKRLGAEIYTTVSTEAKAALAKGAGADHVINYSTDDFEEAVKQGTGGKGVQVVYDAVGKTTFVKSLNCLAPRGYLVLYGQASGPVDPISPQILAKGSNFLTRAGMGFYTSTREELLSRANDILGWTQSGELKVRIFDTYPLAKAAEAHRALEGRLTTGKLLLTP
ncbi:MAG: quinone oxidoreductase [Dehalococcoidia bacterium]|nr:quinone oxidoreductase [Dehalococcoidia bacterium]